MKTPLTNHPTAATSSRRGCAPSIFVRVLLLLAALVGSNALAQTPSITSFTPTLGPPGTQVTINGVNFNNATILRFDTTVADFTVISPGQMNAVVPVGATSGKISVNAVQSAGSFAVASRITGFTPPQGGAGTQVQIEGANFIVGSTTVKFNGVAASNVTVTAATQLQAGVPSGATSGAISVSTAAGGATSTNNFTVSTAPIITDFSPAVAPTGTTLAISGANFVNGTTAVKFNGSNSTPATVTAPTQLQVVVPSGATTGPLTVTNNGTGLAFTTSSNFVTGNRPIITGFDPGVAAPNASGIFINGYNFSGATSVIFSNNKLATITSVASTQLQVSVPSGAVTGPVIVTTPSGNGTSTVAFVTGTAPIITNFTPIIGSPGTQITFAGINFLNATALYFNNSAVTPNVTSDSQMFATVPAGATSGPIRVVGAGQTNVTSSNFTVTGSGPFISSFLPASGARGTTVTNYGANFVNVTGVSFNGVAATAFAATSTDKLTVDVPFAATTGPITVTATSGSYTTPALFYLPPRLTSMSASSGVAGATIMFTGVNFTNATDVSFNGASAAFTVNSATQITATVPTNATTGPVTITTPGGPIISANSFSILPNVTSFDPALGPVGTLVTINGTSFFSVSQVRFGAGSAVFTNVSSTQITATVPASATTGPIQITTTNGTGSSATNFIVTMSTDLATSMTFSPPIITEGEAVTFSIIVSNLGPSIATGVVLTDPLPAGAAFVSATSSQGSCVLSNGVVRCSLGVITNGFTATVTIVMTLSTSGSIENDATATAIEPDTFGLNNLAVTSTPVVSVAQRTLSIAFQSATREVTVSWPQSVVNFVLQFNTNLVTTNNLWFDSPLTPVTVTNQSTATKVVTDSAVAPRKFYRLRSP